MSIITIDLGTTNTKVSCFDRNLRVTKKISRQVPYIKDDDFVEIDPIGYIQDIKEMISSCATDNLTSHIDQISITGQAESLVILDKSGDPLLPIISWLDKRSADECHILEESFGKECYSITGQPAFIPTWPISKILWLRRNKQNIFNQAHKYLLLKDYVIYCLTGEYLTDFTIAGFSCYFNITTKYWWTDILDFVGIHPNQLPDIVPPNTIISKIRSALTTIPGIDKNTSINSGLLDHFAGMIGTGNIRRGIISESAGTVLSLATFVDKPISELRLPTYCGPFPDTYVILPVCESGGICLEWYKNEFLADNNFHMIDETILTEKKKKVPIFLPYIAGTNAPYFNEWEKGVFFGFTAITSKFDFALSIMQGVACLLQMNIEYLESCGIEVDKLISTGGGAKSRLWTQIKSDITGREILVPKNEEAPSLGAALLSSIHCGYFESLETALPNTISVSKVYTPSNIKDSQQIYKNFRNVYSSLIEAFKEF